MMIRYEVIEMAVKMTISNFCLLAISITPCDIRCMSSEAITWRNLFIFSSFWVHPLVAGLLIFLSVICNDYWGQAQGPVPR
jgi:hypothetical protein